MKHPNAFSKAEHLCGEKRISKLFVEGEAFICYPLRVLFRIEPKLDVEPASIWITADFSPPSGMTNVLGILASSHPWALSAIS